MIDETRRRYLGLCAAGTTLALAGCLSSSDDPQQDSSENTSTPDETDAEDEDDDDTDDPKQIDDWQYEPSEGDDSAGGQRAAYQTTASTAQADAAESSIGLSAGGAADVNTFRRNVEEGNIPIPESMAYEGLFYDYYFDTGGDGSCGGWFCPTYTPAVTDDPLSGETERYLSVGLDSGLSQSEFERPPLNLVVVLDISGSMGSSFDEYYYDRFGNRQEVEGGTDRPKIEVAKDALADLTEQLRPEDRFGVVLFSSDSSVAKPLRSVEETDMEAIRGHIREDIRAAGGTNISSGMEAAEGLLDEVVEEGSEYENRSIVLTDAQINTGETGANTLRSNLQAQADKEMHTSVIGVGVDFNADLIDQLTAVRGANYYSVNSTDEFEQRMVDQFEFMVTPLVYDLSLELDADGYDIKQVYGSSAAEEATGELMSINTLFPSPSEEGRAKGGVVLVAVEQTEPTDADLQLRASWERRDGFSESATETITFPQQQVWGSDAIRKAVLLAREADLLKHWAVSERDEQIVREAYDVEEEPEPPEEPTPPGIEPPEVPLSQWELQSQPLSVSAENEQRIRTFREHFEAEMSAIGDDTLQQELELLDAILAAA